MNSLLKVPLLRSFLLLITMVTLAACGNDSGGEEPSPSPTPTNKSATLKLSTSGTPAINMAGIATTITLPDGVTPYQNNDGTLTEPLAVVSGVAAPGMVLAPIYLPANSTTKGRLSFALASSIVTGFSTGEYATVFLKVENEAHPGLTDFELTDFTPIDVNGNEAAELTVMVTELVVQ